MDKKSPPQADQPRAEKILLTILLVITIVFVGYTFYKTLIRQDFEVVNTEVIEEDEEGVTGDEAVIPEDSLAPSVGETDESAPEDNGTSQE